MKIASATADSRAMPHPRFDRAFLGARELVASRFVRASMRRAAFMDASPLGACVAATRGECAPWQHLAMGGGKRDAWHVWPNPAFNRTPRRRGFMPNRPSVAAVSRLTSSC